MTTTTPRSPLRALLGAPIRLRTYRHLAYLLLAVPIGLGYFVALALAVSLTVGFGLTLIGPVALVGTLLTVVSLAWVDAHLTGGLLGVDVDPAFPDTDGDAVGFLTDLFVGRATWAGAAFLLWRVVLGFVALIVLTVGGSLAFALLSTPFAYGSDVGVFLSPTATYAIDTLPRALAAAGVGLLVALATLGVASLLGRASGALAETLLDAPDAPSPGAPTATDPPDAAPPADATAGATAAATADAADGPSDAADGPSAADTDSPSDDADAPGNDADSTDSTISADSTDSTVSADSTDTDVDSAGDADDA